MPRVHRGLIFGACSIFLVAAGCRETTAPHADHCADPAPLLGRFDPAAPNYIVVFRDGFDGVAETKRLTDKYGFTPSSVWSSALDGFAAPLTDGIVASLRCEPSVANIAHDAVVRVD